MLRRLLIALREKWRARQRAMDERILFPIILKKAPTLAAAVKALAIHVQLDSAWEGREQEAFDRFRKVADEEGF